MATRTDCNTRWRPVPAGGSEKGFTLMEVMVALTVVAIALTAIYRMHTQTLFMDARGRFETLASMLARQKLAEIQSGGLNGLIDDSGDFAEHHPGYQWRIASENVSSDLIREDGPGLKRISVTISDSATAAAFNLTTYRFVYE